MGELFSNDHCELAALDEVAETLAANLQPSSFSSAKTIRIPEEILTIRALIQLIHRAQKDSGGFFPLRSTVVAVLASLHNHASLKIRIEAVEGLRALNAREVMQFLRDPRPEVRRLVP